MFYYLCLKEKNFRISIRNRFSTRAFKVYWLFIKVPFLARMEVILTVFLKWGCRVLNITINTYLWMVKIQRNARSVGITNKLTTLKNLVTFQDRQAYKQKLLQFEAHLVNYSPSGKTKLNKGLKYLPFISRLIITQLKNPANFYNNLSM